AHCAYISIALLSAERLRGPPCSTETEFAANPEAIAMSGSDMDLWTTVTPQLPTRNSEEPPMYPVVGELLRSRAFQMERAERIHEQYVYYLDRVCGPDNINVHKSWESLSRFLRDENIISVGNLDTSLMQEMTRAFPQRAAYLGNESLAALIRQAYAD